MARPWGVEAIRSMYGPGVRAELHNGRWVIAVAEPYSTNLIERVRAVAFEWPKAGDLESALGWDSPQRQQAKH